MRYIVLIIFISLFLLSCQNTINCSEEGKNYVSHDLTFCASNDFICADASKPFTDECGCGCQVPTQ